MPSPPDGAVRIYLLVRESLPSYGVAQVEWFRAGELGKVAEYCKADVDITRRVFEFGRDNGHVFYKSKLGSKLKVNVKWK